MTPDPNLVARECRFLESRLPDFTIPDPKSVFTIPDPESVARESKFPECRFPELRFQIWAGLGWGGLGWGGVERGGAGWGGVERGQDSQNYIFVYFRSVIPAPHGKLGVLQKRTLVIRIEQR